MVTFVCSVSTQEMKDSSLRRETGEFKSNQLNLCPAMHAENARGLLTSFSYTDHGGHPANHANHTTDTVHAWTQKTACWEQHVLTWTLFKPVNCLYVSFSLTMH